MPIIFFPLLLLFSLGAQNRPALAEEDVSNIPLIATGHYDPSKEAGRGFRQFTSSLSLAAFGRIALSEKSVEESLREKLDMPELRRYFPDAREKAALARRIAATVAKKYLSQGMKNEVALQAIEYSTSELVGAIILRAMEAEGVKDESRRSAWANRILSPFRQCMKKTLNYKEGTKCLDALQADVVKNIGLAINVEMIRQETAPAYAEGAGAAYARCLRLREPRADDRVQACVIQGMRAAVGNYGPDKVRESARAEVPNEADAIARKTQKTFRACLAKASERNGFSRCADQLVAEAGGEVVAAAIMNNAQVKTYFPSAKERTLLAGKSQKNFLDCLEGVRKRGERDPSGALSTAACAAKVRMDTTRSVAEEVLEKNLNEVQGLAAAEKKAIAAEVSRELRECWDSAGAEKKNNECMRSVVELLVGSVAELKLEKNLSPALLKKEPKLKSDLVQAFRGCVKENLPRDLMKSPESADKVNICAARLTREAALKAASFGLQEVMLGKTTDTSAPARLVKELVDDDFAPCLGGAPDERKVGFCSARLKRAAGASVATLLFREEFDRFFDSNGGLEAFGHNAKSRDDFLGQLNRGHQKCLAFGVKESEPQKADAVVDVCFKNSIRMLAGHIAGIAFESGMRVHLKRRADLSRFTDEFRAEFESCLREKDAPSFSVNDYVANIDTCRGRLTTAYTLKIGKKQLTEAAGENIEDAGRRLKIEGELFQQFGSCLGAKSDNKTINRCADTLKRNATYAIALESAAAQAKKILNDGPPPREMEALNKKLDACLKSNRDPDACAREHALSLAKLLGSLKLRFALSDALGKDDYFSSASRVKELEGTFFRCVESLPGEEADAAFVAALKDCGDQLENAGIDFVQERLAGWLSKERTPAAAAPLSDVLVTALPCLDAVIPGKAVNEQALNNIDPEGILESVAKFAGSYINYDAQRAGQDFDKVLRQLIADLEAAGPVGARQKLLDLLVKEGMVDQFLKSMVRAEIVKKLGALAPEDRLSPRLEALLTSNETLDAAMTPELMARFRPFMADKLLKPLLIEGKSLNAPEQRAARKALENQVAESLLDTAQFGEALVRGSIEQNVRNQSSGFMTPVTWALTKLGTHNFDWDAVRATPAGAAAEAYVKDQVIRPMVLGEELTPDQLASRRAEAKRLVMEAVKIP